MSEHRTDYENSAIKLAVVVSDNREYIVEALNDIFERNPDPEKCNYVINAKLLCDEIQKCIKELDRQAAKELSKLS